MTLVKPIKNQLSLEYILSRVRHLSHDDIVRKSVITLLIQGMARFLRFIFWIVVARLFATDVVGELVFGLAFASVFSDLCVMGGNVLIAREWGYSELNLKEKLTMAHEQLNGFFYRGVLFIGILFSFFYLYLTQTQHAQYIKLDLLLFLFIIPYFIFALARAYFIAIQKVFVANIIDLVVSVNLLAPAGYFYYLHHELPYQLIMTIFSIITTMAFFLIVFSMLRYGLKAQKVHGCQMSIVLTRVGGLLYSFIDLTVLKVFSDSISLAHYGIALQMSVIVRFGLKAINQNTMSKVAESYKLDKKAVFQEKISSYAKVIFIFTVLPVLFLIIFAPYLFQLYGQVYHACYSILLILIVGNVVDALLGSVGLILNMAGYEKEVAKTFWQCMLMNVLLATGLVHFYAAIGVAISTMISGVMWNILLYLKIKRTLGVDPSAFFWLLKKS